MVLAVRGEAGFKVSENFKNGGMSGGFVSSLKKFYLDLVVVILTTDLFSSLSSQNLFYIFYD
jgi:hypothetical protein